MTEQQRVDDMWSDSPSWLRELSRSHHEGFRAANTRSVWRYSREPLALSSLSQSHETASWSKALLGWIDCHRIAGYDCYVFHNGQWFSDLSDATDEHVYCWRAHPGLENANGALSRQLASPLSAMAQFDLSFVRDGLRIHVPDGQKRRIQILTTGSELSESLNTCGLKHMITVGKAARLDLIECHGPQVDCAMELAQVVSIDLDDQAICHHHRVYLAGDWDAVFMHDECRLGEESVYQGSRFVSCCGVVRDGFWSTIGGEAAHCQLNALYLLHSDMQTHQFTQMNHQAPRSTSRQTYRAIASGSASVNIHGRVVIDQAAEMVDANQQGKHLVLGSGAKVNTLPEIEVYTDNVSCAHGACVGQIDADALYYCQSRGLDLDQSRKLLMTSHFESTLMMIECLTFRAWLKSMSEALFDLIEH